MNVSLSDIDEASAILCDKLLEIDGAFNEAEAMKSR